MKRLRVKPQALVLAATIAAVWGLRRIGMDAATADLVVSALVVGLGLSPSALPERGPK